MNKELPILLSTRKEFLTLEVPVGGFSLLKPGDTPEDQLNFINRTGQPEQTVIVSLLDEEPFIPEDLFRTMISMFKRAPYKVNILPLLVFAPLIICLCSTSRLNQLEHVQKNTAISSQVNCVNNNFLCLQHKTGRLARSCLSCPCVRKAFTALCCAPAGAGGISLTNWARANLPE